MRITNKNTLLKYTLNAIHYSTAKKIVNFTYHRQKIPPFLDKIDGWGATDMRKTYDFLRSKISAYFKWSRLRLFFLLYSCKNRYFGIHQNGEEINTDTSYSKIVLLGRIK